MKDEIKEIERILATSGKYITYAERCYVLDYITNLQEENERLKNKLNIDLEWAKKCDDLFIERNNYKSRNEKANTLLDEMLERAYIDGEYIMYDYSTSELLEVKQALEGEDKDE